MVKKTTKWEAEIDPPTIHDTAQEAVIAELAFLLGYRGSNEREGISLALGIATKIVAQPAIFIATIQQAIPANSDAGTNTGKAGAQ